VDQRDARLQTLLDQAFAQHQKLGETLDEIHQLINKQPTIGQYAKRCLDYFVKHWERRYRAKLVINGAEDMAKFKRALKQISPEDVAARTRAYFQQEDTFVVEAKHSIGVFMSRLNELAPANGTSNRPIGCNHQPPCPDDVAHTRLALHEQRNRK
jgi:hypothetical protein